MGQHGTILTFIKFSNFSTQVLNGPRHLHHSFCYTTQHIFEPLCVNEPTFLQKNAISSGMPYHLIKGGTPIIISCVLIFLLGQDESQGITTEMADSQK